MHNIIGDQFIFKLINLIDQFILNFELNKKCKKNVYKNLKEKDLKNSTFRKKNELKVLKAKRRGGVFKKRGAYLPRYNY